MRRRALLVAAALAVGALAAPSSSAAPREDAVATEHYIATADPLTVLHADVLRPKGLAPDVRTPVIMTVSPYTNHAAQTGTDYDPTATGPSERFYDMLDLTGALDRGYTYVIVDLPGFGGSRGCNDWGGPREQGAVKTAVEWAAAQPWSTGKVALFGKSYDAWTGLMGMAQQPQGLAAVVAMEPVYSGYRYGYNDGVRFSNSVLTPLLFTANDATPGSTKDSPEYLANSASQAYCYPLNVGLQQQDSPDAAYWVERDLLRTTKGVETPLFLTQGFLERNTKPDGAFDFFNALGGTHNRAWFGQFDHVRGYEKQGERFAMGRSVFVEEMNRFLDQHLKGLPPKGGPDAPVAVQDATGRYRAEQRWPAKDTVALPTALRTGTYADDNGNRGTGSGGKGIWTISEPLEQDAWLSGEPVLEAAVTTTLPRANLVGNVYDIDPDGRATLISRGTTLLRAAGAQQARIPLYGQDWPVAAGHRIGVLVSGSNAEWWVHAPTRQTVTVTGATMTLPFLTKPRTQFLDGEATPRLEQHLDSAFVEVPEETVAAATSPFALPGRAR